MDSNLISNKPALFYYFYNISNNWTLSNPYGIALKALVRDENKLNIENLRPQQEFHFIAKIIQDEINKNNVEINNNIKNIHSLIDNYLKDMNSDNGNQLINFIFTIFQLNLLNKKEHNKILNIDKVKIFIEKFNTENFNYKNKYNIVALYYGFKKEIDEKQYISNDYELSLSMLYDRLALCDKAYKNEVNLLKYYIKQRKIEEINIIDEMSERNKINFLEIVINVKLTSGEGLYLPEIEKENYLSTTLNKYFREIFVKKFENYTHLTIASIKISIWSLLLIYFIIETLFFLIPPLFSSLSIPLTGIGISIEYITKLENWKIVLVNGILLSVIAFYREWRIKKSLREDNWI